MISKSELFSTIFFVCIYVISILGLIDIGPNWIVGDGLNSAKVIAIGGLTMLSITGVIIVVRSFIAKWKD